MPFGSKKHVSLSQKTQTHTEESLSQIPTKINPSKPTNKPELLSTVIYTINVTIPELQSRLVVWNTVLNKTVILNQRFVLLMAQFLLLPQIFDPLCT